MFWQWLGFSVCFHITDGKVAEKEGKRADKVHIVDLSRNDRPSQRRYSAHDGELLKGRGRPGQACVLDNFLWWSLVRGCEVRKGADCSDLDEGWWDPEVGQWKEAEKREIWGLGGLASMWSLTCAEVILHQTVNCPSEELLGVGEEQMLVKGWWEGGAVEQTCVVKQLNLWKGFQVLFNLKLCL